MIVLLLFMLLLIFAPLGCRLADQRLPYRRRFRALRDKIMSTDNFVTLCCLETDIDDYAQEFRKHHAAAKELAQTLFNLLEVRVRSFITSKDRQQFIK